VTTVGQFAHQVCRGIGVFAFSLSLISGAFSAYASPQGPTAQPAATIQTYKDAEAYSIYGILLEGKGTYFVIRAETESWSAATPEKMGIKGDRTFYKIWGPVLNDYARQFREPKIITQNIPVKGSYELVTKQALAAVLKPSGNWTAFYDVYPQSNGYYWFSAVGFDPQRTHAIVSMNHSCGPLCGRGEPHFFEKKNGKWQEVTAQADWEVWLS
jgi:hypothetical protein